MEAKTQVYEVGLSTENEVYAISLVERPANQTEFMLFSEVESETIKLSSFEDKQIITGVVLIPNQIINRKSTVTNDIYQFYINEAAIEDLSIKFFENGFQTNSNFQHNQEDSIDDLVYFESWIVKDPLNDKANALGFKNLPKGTWMASAKIKNEETWQRVKSGEVKGFSIEGFLNRHLKLSLDANQKNNSNYKKLDEKEMGLLKELTKVLIKLSETETELASVYTVGQQLENKGVEYSFEENGYTIFVNAEGIVTEVLEISVQDVPQETEVLMTAEADAAAEVIDADTEQISAEVEKPIEEVDIEALKKLIEDLTAKVDILEVEKAKLNDAVVSLSSQPNDVKLSSNEVTPTKETRLETLARIANQK